MDYSFVLETALQQSAEDLGCAVNSFLQSRNVIVPYQPGPEARKYLRPPYIANFVSYGSNVVAAAAGGVQDIVREYTERYTFYHLFETPNLLWLNSRLTEAGCGVCFMAAYYLPVPAAALDCSCPAEIRLLQPGQFAELYTPEWSNALCADRRHLDVLAAGAYVDGALVGLAGCSADCTNMWQVGVDVLPAYRRGGIAAALVRCLTQEILQRGKVPFYCAAWSNLRSVRTALRSGYRPAWVELTAKPAAEIRRLNEKQDQELRGPARTSSEIRAEKRKD